MAEKLFYIEKSGVLWYNEIRKDDVLISYFFDIFLGNDLQDHGLTVIFHG